MCRPFLYIFRYIICQNQNFVFLFPFFQLPLSPQWNRSMETKNKPLPVLTVTGSDSTGESGIQADIKIITALGGYAVSAITSITVQNTLGIQDFFDLPSAIVAGQIEAIIDDIQPAAVKIGMARSVEVVDAITLALTKYRPPCVVYDPIVVSSRNELLMSTDVIERIQSHFLKHCTLVVISRQAASYFLNRKIETIDEMTSAAVELLHRGSKAVLLQEGMTSAEMATDLLLIAGEQKPRYLFSPAAAENVHGIGGTLSSAIATYLSQKLSIPEAIENAKSYIRQQTTFSGRLEGRGSELYNEFIGLIASHYQSSNDVRYYADRLNVTTRYLAQVAKRLAGKTPKILIDEYLLKQAEAMLSGSNKTVQEISYDLGFRSQAHFTKFFKKLKNVTPSEYRNNV